MKKLFTLIISFALVSFVVSSCGGESTEKKADKEVEKSAIVEEPTAEPEANQDESMAQDFQKGKEVYKKICFTCHDAGVAGAAKLDNTERWEESAAKGMETLTKHVVNGYTGDYGVLPPKGSCADCSEEDIKEAVAYMLHEAGVSAE